jgi:hypothetical protein
VPGIDETVGVDIDYLFHLSIKLLFVSTNEEELCRGKPFDYHKSGRYCWRRASSSCDNDVGGGERETNVESLIEKIKEHELPMSEFEWYLDLRRFGSVPHSGFGLGLERMVTWVCKLKHVRESIPFPRMYGRLKP